MNNSLDSTSSSLKDQFNFKKRSDRLEFAMYQAGTNELQASKQLNFAQSALNNYKNNRTKSFNRIAELANFLGVSANWLHTGEGSPFVGAGHDLSLNQSCSIGMSKAFYEKHYSKKFADKSLNDLSIQIPLTEFKKLNSSTLSYIYMPDDSMEGEIKYGSVVIIDEDDTFIENGKLYAIIAFDNITIRRTYLINKNITLRVTNTAAYNDQEFERSEVEASGFDIIGKVRLVKNYYL